MLITVAVTIVVSFSLVFLWDFVFIKYVDTSTNNTVTKQEGVLAENVNTNPKNIANNIVEPKPIDTNQVPKVKTPVVKKTPLMEVKEYTDGPLWWKAEDKKIETYRNLLKKINIITQKERKELSDRMELKHTLLSRRYLIKQGTKEELQKKKICDKYKTERKILTSSQRKELKDWLTKNYNECLN